MNIILLYWILSTNQTLWSTLQMDLNNYIGQTMSGERLNHILNGMPLLKFMNDDDVHYGMKYHTGDNLDIVPFNSSGQCQAGGIYVTTLQNFYIFLTSSPGRRLDCMQPARAETVLSFSVHPNTTTTQFRT